jgi:phosphoribosylformylglycinamidine synthase
MAGQCGALLDCDLSGAAHWFGEDQGRYILAVSDGAALLAHASGASIPAIALGRTGGADLTLPDGMTISLEALREAHGRFFPAWMGD